MTAIAYRSRATEEITRQILAIQGDTEEAKVAIERIASITGELADVQATAAKLAQHFRTQVCTEEKISNSF